MNTFGKLGMMGLMVGAQACASAQALGTANPQDVAAVVKAVRQAYPNKVLLCSEQGSIIPSAVTEAMATLGKGSLKGDAQATSRGAVQQLQAGCPR